MATGSIWKALIWTIIAAIVLQVGYFVLVTRLIYQRRTAEERKANQDFAQ
ncbi:MULTISPECIES: exopolysaccharide production repressor protein [unclassified Mesorhizobium]|nr:MULTISPECIES: exopolysaccharide production repressor protein [unclassified Mesorhizobium]